MSKKIILSEDQIASLYKRNLLHINHEYPTPLTETRDDQINYKGGFAKKIAWIHHETEHDYIHDDDFEMLTKILEACKMTWNDIALVNLHHSNLDESTVIATLNPEYVIFSLGNNPTYEIKQSAVIKTIHTHPLSQIRTDKNIKIHLWQALKILFNLK